MLQDIGAVFDLARIHVLTSYGSPADLNLLIFRSFPLILASKAIAGLSTRTGGIGRMSCKNLLPPIELCSVLSPSENRQGYARVRMS